MALGELEDFALWVQLESIVEIDGKYRVSLRVPHANAEFVVGFEPGEALDRGMLLGGLGQWLFENRAEWALKPVVRVVRSFCFGDEPEIPCRIEHNAEVLREATPLEWCHRCRAGRLFAVVAARAGPQTGVFLCCEACWSGFRCLADLDSQRAFQAQKLRLRPARGDEIEASEWRVLRPD